MVLVAGVACSATYPAGPTDAAPLGLQVHYVRAVAGPFVGGAYQFAAYTFTSDGAYEEVTSKATWLSSDPLVFRPIAGAPHSFNAVGTGSVEVLARYSGLTSSISMFVTYSDRQPFPYLSVAPGDPRLAGRRSQSVLRLHTSPTASQEVTQAAAWESSDPRVVTVERGLVTGMSPGTAQITASYNGLSVSYGLSIQPGT
jgi:hypothetical protein